MSVRDRPSSSSTTARDLPSSPPAGGDPGRSPGRRLRIVFSLLHAGYLRHYAEPIRILAARGHAVHIALQREDAKDRGDDVLLARLLADCPSVTAGPAPARHRLDGWRVIAWVARSLTDALRYHDERYRDAPALRLRAVSKLELRAAATRIGVLAKVLVRLLNAWVERGSDPVSRGRANRLLAAVEDAVPPSRRTSSLISALGADLVLASPVVDFASPQVEFVKSAKALGVPAVVCVASWDNLTNKGLLRVLPDRVLVWNERQRDELEEMHGVPRDRVVVTGGQKFDPWFAMAPQTTREEFQRRIGLDPRRPYLLYLCSSRFIAPDEVPAVRRWIGAIRSSGEGLSEVGIVVRPHPQNAEQWARADVSDFPNVCIRPRDGEYPDAGDAQRDFFETIHHSAAVVGVNTSAQIEAAIVGRPVFSLLSGDFATTQTGTLHYHYVRHENGGFVHEASDMDSHLAQLRAALDGSGGIGSHRQFLESFVRPRGLGAPVAPIVADEIERIGLERQREPADASRWRWAVRAALLPVVACISATVAIASLGARVRRQVRPDADTAPVRA